MIAIKPYFEPVPVTLSEASLKKKKFKSKYNPTGLDLLQLVLNQQSNHLFDRKVYGATDVKARLETIFHKKCAYCECNISLGAHYDAEHFRPKDLYYWLCYEWTNLLLACQKCNRDHKGIKFPLADPRNRLRNPPIDDKNGLKKADCHLLSTVLSDEQPLLLHPAMDDPKIHLKFLKSGMIQGLTPKGIESIEVYGLNRVELVDYRRKIIHKIQMFILYPFELRDDVTELDLKYRVKEVLLTQIWGRMMDSAATFIGFTTAVWEHFEEFIIENTDGGFSMPYKTMMKNVYKETKQILDP